ncbi:hypothetical protein H257_09892 [Aphanomyces astaci]|uniref:Uncharacterized protein n=1 Tax=Aphanomyces astaci TaxID=112090 RepID=W4G8A1_APHAT|nr:hypothetical protein H257_09892 [Aphanomyces astaci]ETV75932.1 hypothetical protein H257_09892 [Aphanomyces astaci]|eukprot:XP_009834574.1 hypothetical protein H257_09892 [Aphanomyces astaci]
MNFLSPNVAFSSNAADINVINDTKASIRKYLYTTVLRIKDVSSNLVVGALIAPKYVLITPSTDVERMKLVKQTKYPKSKPSTKATLVKGNLDPVVAAAGTPSWVR